MKCSKMYFREKNDNPFVTVLEETAQILCYRNLIKKINNNFKHSI